MAAPAPTQKGSGLTKKLGPLPLWAWAVIGVVVAYVLYRALSGTTVGSSGAATQEAQTTAATPAAATGDASTADTSGDAQATSDLVTALGGQQASTLSALESLNEDVVGLAQSQISYLSQNTAAGSFTSETSAQVQSQPGTLNAPAISYVAPSTSAGTSAQPVTAQVATKSSAASSSGGQPYGGITGTKKLANGATLTTYASGRQVEQVPGKTAYVVKA